MKIKAILFDLDGTLLPMDQDAFTKGYFKSIAIKMANYGYEPELLIKTIIEGTAHMVKNDGSMTNEERFWECFNKVFGERSAAQITAFDQYYAENFDANIKFCQTNPKAFETIKALQERSYRLILATNPLFPPEATRKRIAWAGLTPEDFELFTAYDNSTFCKPNLKYYSEILEKAKLPPCECLMVGNDVLEDMIAKELGMKVFLMTDCLINRKDLDISDYPQGDFDALLDYINRLEANCED